MKQMLFALTSWLLSNFAKKVLLGAGVTLVSGAVINAILATYINKAISASSSIDPTYLGLLSISGLDHAISIIIGALVARATILAANVSIKKRDALTRTARLSVCVAWGVSRWRKKHVNSYHW
jgi:hypothetical protein